MLPNISYVTEDGYRYTTDSLGRILKGESPDDLVLEEGKRNTHSQGELL
ncbi:hypothetical protein [Listeria seeligeri]|nr:hypothetical protein [Listeria seeligeri]MBC1431009.1 hypothetical protein [Listeria seeligeri]MBC1534086.1 hypothetical protein [Listeria seeligeri]MBC1741017.1 hypothetical protein [Listeria seeligeri]MBC1746613.1 hypothetical protein [Listeria seeligeri]MBC1749455.1 hypothetical protein [Listeria seeligeri]